MRRIHGISNRPHVNLAARGAAAGYLDMKHIPALDGFRGMAILMVIAFHAQFLWSGWAGVQVFFVLSGFLITSILLGAADSPLPAYLKYFYTRRVLRIFPLYYGCLAATALVFLVGGVPRVFARDWVWLFTYTFNIRHALPGPMGWYGHLWSLCVEEQFYFAWPFLIYFLPRPALRRLAFGLVILCPLLRAAIAQALKSINPDPAFYALDVYYLTVCQLDAFAAGALIALCRERTAKHALKGFVASTGLLLGLGILSASAARGRLVMNTSFGYPMILAANKGYIWGYTLIDLWAAAFLNAVIHVKWLATFFSNAALRRIGKISYGMYVFHPLVNLGFVALFPKPYYGIANLAVFSLYFSVVVAVSELSFRFYESRFLAAKAWFSPANGRPLSRNTMDTAGLKASQP